jgi:hypothetical protein
VSLLIDLFSPLSSSRVPVGTTPELQDLLFGLLRRNAKERMPFDVFFNHPFLQRHPPAQQQQAAGKTMLATFYPAQRSKTFHSFFQLTYLRPLHSNNNSSSKSPTIRPLCHALPSTTTIT